MSRRWIEANREPFARDIMRDFCMASKVLEEQFDRFEEAGAVSFTVMRDLLGNMMNKGLLWRLKDTAHHLFRTDEDEKPIARMLDWAIGYIFHECIKLKEDAYQQQHYAPLYRALQRQPMCEELEDISAPLSGVLDQTRESMEREVTRIRFILTRCRELICLYYRRHGENRLLARLMFDRYELIRSVFKEHYPELISNIYQDVPERLFYYAAESLVEGGRPEEALRAADEALALNPDCKRAMEVKDRAHALYETNSPRRAVSQ